MDTAQEQEHKVSAAAKQVPRTAPVGDCPLCGEAGSRLLFRVPDRLHGTAGEFTYRRCPRCRTVFQDPRVIPDDLKLCYPDDYYTHAHYAHAELVQVKPIDRRGMVGRLRDAIRNAVQGVWCPGLVGLLGRVLARSRRLRERAFRDYVTDDGIPHYVTDELLPRSPGRRALEIGCGSGILLIALKCVGWEVEGVEWDTAMAKVAGQVSGRPVHEGDFRQVDLPHGAYDLIVLDHVFEHLGEPLAALTRIRDLLAPGGQAVLSYPNPESLGAWLFEDAWFPLEAPRHLVLPPGRSLAKAAQEVGLKPVQLRTRPGNAEDWFTYSRVFRAGQRIDLHAWPTPTRKARLTAALERVLLFLRLPVGEEVLLVLRKERGDKS